MYSTFPVGDWASMERNSIWWLQEPITSALACGEVHEEGKAFELVFALSLNVYESENA